MSEALGHSSISDLAEINIKKSTGKLEELAFCSLPVKSEWLVETAGKFDKLQFAVDASGRLLLLGWTSESDTCSVIPVSFRPRL